MAATSSPSLSFPSTSTPVKSNPHPYAIKTTSTGILTRSNSTRSSVSSSHHFVPSSPSKHKSTHSNDSTSSSSARPRAHKYSRSLNSNELPRPLPIPPNFPSSTPPMTSPTTSHFEPHSHYDPASTTSPIPDDTLPSSLSQSDLRSGVDDLPADPRIWSPSQLSTYLASSSLRVTAGDVSPLVVQDMAAFVRTQKINGRKFLRLTEGDLDKYGLNQRWQSALLAASRGLRQDSLRGRIWTSSSAYPSAAGADAAEQDDDNENYSSTSSLSSSGSISGLHRERAGSQSGRVKGMVASFERHGTPSSSSRSLSPTKDSTATATAGAGSSLPSSGGRSISPVKVGDNASDFGFIRSQQPRPRPQSDTFPSYSRPSFMSSNNNSVTETMMVSPSPHALGDAPEKVEQPRRLLPLPPQLPQLPPPPHNTTSPQPQFDSNLVSSFGPYVLSPHQDDHAGIGGGGGGTPFPQGVLPFSPQPTGTVMGVDSNHSSYATISSSPGDMMRMMISSPPIPTQAQPPIYASSPQPQQQQPPFDTIAFSDNHLHSHHFAEGGVRPLPLPPHPTQFYQPLISADNTNFVDGVSNNNDNNSEGAPFMSYSVPVQYRQGDVIIPSSSSSPHLHQQQQRVGLPAVPVPHVQMDQVQAPVTVSFVPDSSSSPHYHQHHHQQEYFQLNSPIPAYPSYQPEQPIHIHAPQPRLGTSSTPGRNASPTKVLEEKLEELLEPRRPRSRILPPGSTGGGGGSLRSVSGVTAAGVGGGHSKSRSTPGLSGSGTNSRPRSRVPSMNFTVTNVGGDEVKKVMNGSVEHQDGTTNNNNNNNTLGVPSSIGLGTPSSSHNHHPPPRTRVISLPRTHSHRLSGVEAWGESHRHIVVPSDDDIVHIHDGEDNDDIEIVPHHHHHDPSNEEAQVKELEGEEEVGIEALLEKDVPPLPLPPVMVIPEEEPDTTTIPPRQHVKREASGTGSISGTTTTHSRAGSIREPKSAVITVIEPRRSSARLRKQGSDVGVVLPPTSPTTGIAGEVEESIEALLAKADALGTNDGSIGVRKGGKQRKRTPMNGAEAWEMIGNVDTVKHLDGAEPENGSVGGGGGLSRSFEDIFSPAPVPLNQPRPSPSQIKTKIKPKDPQQQQPLKSEEDDTVKELEKSIGETKKMVEEIKCRLDKVEQWISDTERREYQQQQRVEDEKARARARGPSGVDMMRRVMLSASRVPGMLGLSAWLGSSSSSPASTSTSSSASSASTPDQTGGTRNPATSKRSSLILRFARLGLSFSTYTVLFGISFCVIVLRMLGRRPGGGGGGPGGVIAAGLGGRGRMVNGNGVIPGR